MSEGRDPTRVQKASGSDGGRPTGPVSLNWLDDLKASYGGSFDLFLQPVVHDDVGAPLFELNDVQRAEIEIPGDSVGVDWEERIRTTIAEVDWKSCFVNALAVPARTLTKREASGTLKDAAALLMGVLDRAPQGRTVAALLPAHWLSSASGADFRTALHTGHQVQWLIFLSGEASGLLGVHSAFRMVLLVVRTGGEQDEQELLRVMNLDGVPRASWRKMVGRSAEAAGGETKTSVVVRDPVLDDKPWPFQRFRKEREEIREDVAELGRLRPLGKMLERISLGLSRRSPAFRHAVEETNEGADHDHLPCFSGRSIRPGGQLGAPAQDLDLSRVDEAHLLRPNDILVRRIFNSVRSSTPAFAALVKREHLPATFDDTCFCLRFPEETSPFVCELTAGFLNSEHARKSLAALGVDQSLSLSKQTLGALETPDPSAEVLGACHKLMEAEAIFLRFANNSANARERIFAAPTFREAVPELIELQRKATEQIRALEDSQTTDYRIRNYFPHPIALRRQILIENPHGASRAGYTLECAEHTIGLLGILALLQLQSHDMQAPAARAQLDSFRQGGDLLLDWGKSIKIVEVCARVTERHANPLKLPFPFLGQLGGPLGEPESDLASAERELRLARNRHSHLQRLTEPEFREVSERLGGELDKLLEAVPFLADLSLVRVIDYELSAVGNKRRGVFHLLQGSSAAFPRIERSVDRELPRSDVGFLDHQGRYVSAFPWLFAEQCSRCLQRELFIFNRVERGTATYIAMETGHPQERSDLANVIADFFRSGPNDHEGEDG